MQGAVNAGGGARQRAVGYWLMGRWGRPPTHSEDMKSACVMKEGMSRAWITDLDSGRRRVGEGHWASQ